jgi:CheY-like chemotaxis protein
MSTMETSAAQPVPLGSDLVGMRVLWIDDTSRTNRGDLQRLLVRGVEVIEARSLREAEAILAAGSPQLDLLISDLTRNSDPHAGFADLQSLRERGRYDSPVAFVTSRITAERRERAKEFGAVAISGNADAALAFLERQASGPASAGSPGAAATKGVPAGAPV